MLKLNNIKKEYTLRDIRNKKTKIIAVNNASISLLNDEMYSLVGESGSGKSTLAKLIVNIEKPTRGEIIFDSINLSKLCNRELRKKRRNFQLVMQNGQGSLDPRFTVFDSIKEPLINLEGIKEKDTKKKVVQAMSMVELPLNLIDRLPHELSGGQQKRVCIARAIVLNPKLIVFDEAVSGLDVTIRKKILDLLINLRKEIRSTYLFITHDIEAALYISKNILVMKDGNIVENIENIRDINDFKHEYSKSLLENCSMKNK